MPRNKPLTQLQRNFVTAYLLNGHDAQAAALQVGYTRSFAKSRSYQLLRHPGIAELVSQQRDKLTSKMSVASILSVQDIIRTLERIVQDVVPLDVSLPVKRKYVGTAIKAIAELNKMMGHYAPTKSVSLTLDATRQRLIDAGRQYEDH